MKMLVRNNVYRNTFYHTEKPEATKIPLEEYAGIEMREL